MNKKNLGVIGYLNSAGIGSGTYEFVKKMKPKSLMLFENRSKPILKSYYDDAIKMTNVVKPVSGGHPDRKDFITWIDDNKLDTIYFNETPKNFELFDICNEKGIKLIAMIMWEWFDMTDKWKEAHILICPTKFTYEYLKEYGFKNIKYLPYPINTDVLKKRKITKAKTFLFNYGFKGLYDRKGGQFMFEAIRRLHKINENIKFYINSFIDVGDFCNATVFREQLDFYYQCYMRGDMAIQPTRLEGVGLANLESLACGMPTITTDIAPVNEFVPDIKLLVDYKDVTIYKRGRVEVPYYNIDVDALCDKILYFYNRDIRDLSMACRKRITDNYSWNVLLDEYKGIFFD